MREPMSEPFAQDERAFGPPPARWWFLILLTMPWLIQFSAVGIRENFAPYRFDDARAPLSYCLLALFGLFWWRLARCCLRAPTFVVTESQLWVVHGQVKRALPWSGITGHTVRSGGRLTLSLADGEALTFHLMPQQLSVVVAALTSCLRGPPRLLFDGTRDLGAWLDAGGLAVFAFIYTNGALADHPYGWLVLSCGLLASYLVSWRRPSQPVLALMFGPVELALVYSMLGTRHSFDPSPAMSAFAGLWMAVMLLAGLARLGLFPLRAAEAAAHSR